MPLPTDERLRAIAREILDQDRYARWRSDDVAVSWVAWLLAELADLQRAMADLASRSPMLFALLLTALGLVAVLLLGHVVWTIRRSLRPVDEHRPAQPIRRSPGEAAAALAERGRFLDAARLLQLAVLEHLARRHLVAVTPAESNAALAGRLEAAPLPDDLGDRTVTLLRALEYRWFRDRVEDEALYAAWLRLHGDVTAAASS